MSPIFNKESENLRPKVLGQQKYLARIYLFAFTIYFLFFSFIFLCIYLSIILFKFYFKYLFKILFYI